MAMYRITKFTASNSDKAGEIAEQMRNVLENGDGECVVVTKYLNQAALDAATEIAKQAFSKMVEARAINGASIQPKAGEVFISF